MNTQELIELVKSEIKPSLGCTEPVAVGLAVSNTCVHLSKPATHLHLRVSSNVFKNAYFVTIPGTQECGIPISASLGFLLTKEGNTMEIFSGITQDLIAQAKEYVANEFVSVEVIKETHLLIEVTATNDEEKVYSLTYDSHDRMLHLEKNGEVLINIKNELEDKKNSTIMSMKVAELVEIAKEVPIEDIKFMHSIIDMNKAASNEGLLNDYGMRIGKSIRKMMEDKIVEDDLFYHVKMTVAAAVDMRMGGGPLSAMTLMGSGNQGFEASLPIIATSEFLKLDEETTLRALFMCYLISIRIKYAIGVLSPICSALFTGAGSSAAIAWILGGNQRQMEDAMQYMFSSLSGIVCDGAKDSCASKLCNCAGEAVLSARLALYGSAPDESDGLISEAVEHTIDNLARVSNESMTDVDINLIDIMMNKQ